MFENGHEFSNSRTISSKSSVRKFSKSFCRNTELKSLQETSTISSFIFSRTSENVSCLLSSAKLVAFEIVI